MSSAWSYALVACAALSSACARHELPTATIQVGEHAVLVEVASEPAQRNKGLMLRDSLPANEGMLFVYPDQKPRAFWMKNTRIPLTIAFADSDGKIVSMSDMRPLDTSMTKSLYPAMYALEMNQGWFEDHGVAVGDKLGKLPDVTAH